MKNIRKIATIILSIIAFISFFIIIKSNFYNFEIEGLKPILSPVVVTYQLKEKPKDDSLMNCFSDFCTSPEIYKHSYINSYNKKTKYIFLSQINNPDFKNNIENIIYEIGNTYHYLNKEDISSLQNKTADIILDDSGNIAKYNGILISDINNYNGILNHILVIFLSLFYGWKMFIIPYLCIFLMVIINKYNYSFKSPNIILFSIIALAIILRVNGILYYPLWFDELYTKTVAIKDLKSVFIDPGNPCLFYFLEFIISKIFNDNILTLRILPLMFSCAIIPFVYLIFKNYSKNFALFASFLASINTIFIYHAQEMRGYSMCMFLSILAIYIFLKYIDNPNIKYLILYGIIASLLINSNYYLILFVFMNFIWGLIKLKDKKIQFILANFIAGLTFIPYLLISIPTALNNEFNGWIPPLNKYIISYAINQFFLNKYIFLILALLLIFAIIFCHIKKENKTKNLITYLAFSFIGIIILSLLISYFVKPIFHKRVLLSIYGILFVLELSTILPFIKYKFKEIYIALFIITYFSITSPMRTREACNINSYINFIRFDSKNYENVVAIIPDNIEFLKAYSDLNNNIKWEIQKTNSSKTGFKIDKNKYEVLYYSTIGNDIDDNDYIYSSNLTHYAKYKKGDNK